MDIGSIVFYNAIVCIRITSYREVKVTRPYSVITCLHELADPGKTRIILYPNDVKVETKVNWWSMGREPHHTLADLEAIETGLWKLARTWTSHFTFYSNPFNARRATFYAWYDELAGQLCVCMVSQSKPPFGASRVIVDSPRPILQQFLQDRTPGIISMDERDSTEESNSTAPPVGVVWVYSKTW